jgi:Fur family peroxide stress response transcriptional regulator
MPNGMMRTEQPALDQEQSLRTLLKEYGLRYSKPREAILAFFQERPAHVSAEALHLILKRRGENLSLSTVYLNLNVLAEAGLVREFSGVHGEALYDNNVEPHYHLICRVCNDIVDLPALTIGGTTPTQHLKRHAEQKSGWAVDEPVLNLTGVCHQCQNG